MSRRSVGRSIASQIQKEASDRPESNQVDTPFGQIWMSPIDLRLHQEMRREGLSPEPQLCIQGYFVDFAFANVKVAVEADGSSFHEGDRREHDRERQGSAWCWLDRATFPWRDNSTMGWQLRLHRQTRSGTSPERHGGTDNAGREGASGAE